MRKPEPKQAESGARAVFPDADWEKRFPVLCEFLTAVTYDDGTVRKTSSISIREQDGKVLVSMSDHDLERGLYRVGDHVRGALESLEKALTSPNADWRPWRQQKGGKSR